MGEIVELFTSYLRSPYVALIIARDRRDVPRRQSAFRILAIPPEATLEMLRRLPPESEQHRTVAIYEDGYHMLLRDLQAEVVWRDILAWIENPAAGLPSGGDRVDPELVLAD